MTESSYKIDAICVALVLKFINAHKSSECRSLMITTNWLRSIVFENAASTAIGVNLSRLLAGKVSGVTVVLFPLCDVQVPSIGHGCVYVFGSVMPILLALLGVLAAAFFGQWLVTGSDTRVGDTSKRSWNDLLNLPIHGVNGILEFVSIAGIIVARCPARN